MCFIRSINYLFCYNLNKKKLEHILHKNDIDLVFFYCLLFKSIPSVKMLTFLIYFSYNFFFQLRLSLRIFKVEITFYRNTIEFRTQSCNIIS